MSSSSNWSGPFLKKEFCSVGRGYVIEGEVVNSRVHTMFLKDNTVNVGAQDDSLPSRFQVVTIKAPVVFRRIFTEKGGFESELDYHANRLLPDNHKGKVKPSTITTAVLFSEALEPQLKRLLPDRIAVLKKDNSVEFWVDQAKPRARDIAKGHQVRLMTMGNSIFLERFELLNAGVNLAKGVDGGEELSMGWIGNVHNFAEEQDKPLKHEMKQGAADDEWDD